MPYVMILLFLYASCSFFRLIIPISNKHILQAAQDLRITTNIKKFFRTILIICFCLVYKAALASKEATHGIRREIIVMKQCVGGVG